MITPSSSNDNLNEFDARVFIMIGQSLSVSDSNSEETEESVSIIQSLKKSQEDYQREYIQKLYQDIADFEAEKKEKNLELNNLIEISTKLTFKIKENEAQLKKKKKSLNYLVQREN